jgi:hypothetical protein
MAIEVKRKGMLTGYEKPNGFAVSKYQHHITEPVNTPYRKPFDVKYISRGAGTITLQFLDFEAEGNLYIAAGGSPDEKTVALGAGVLYAKIVKATWTVDSIAILPVASYPPAPEYAPEDVDEEFPLYMYRALYLLESKNGTIQIVRDLRDAVGDGVDLAGRPFTHPWQVKATSFDESGNITALSIQFGRVYETDVRSTSGDNPDQPFEIAFRELTDAGLNSPGYVLTGATPPVSSDFMVLLAEKQGNDTYGDTYQVDWEGAARPPGYYVIARIAYVDIVANTVEQIAMGDIWINYRKVAPFSLAVEDGVHYMYIPTNCITLNGEDKTSVTGLTPHATLSRWYNVEGGPDILKLFIQMKYDYATQNYGEVNALEWAVSNPFGGNNEVIEIPVVDRGYTTGVFKNLLNGAIVLELLRPDGTADNSAARSMEKFTGVNRKLQLKNFAAGTDLRPEYGNPFNITSLGTGYRFGIREFIGSAELKWYDSVTFLSDLKDALAADSVWQESLTYVTAYFDQADFDWDDETYGFYAWYDALDAANKKFWEKGADQNINYGSAIGNSGQTEVINLDSQVLVGAWSTETSFKSPAFLDNNGDQVVGARQPHIPDPTSYGGTATSGGYGFADATEFNNFMSGVASLNDAVVALIETLEAHGLTGTT